MSTDNVPSIVIRHAEPADLSGLRRLHDQPRAVWGNLQLPFASAQAWRKRLEAHGSNQYALVACALREIVGEVGLIVADRSPRRHVGQIGVAVDGKWQGRGIGSALLKAAVDLADRFLNLRRLELTVHADNDTAITLYKKFGFEIEGLLRRHSLRDGVLVDVYMLARLR